MGKLVRTSTTTTRSCKLEGNLLEYPLFYFGDRDRPKKKMYTFEEESGKVRKFTVLNAEGLPGAIAQDCLVALMMLRKEKERDIHFFLRKITRQVFRGKKETGRRQHRVKENLERLATTMMKFKDSFFDKGKGQYMSTKIRPLFHGADLYEHEAGKNRREAWKENVFRLGDLFEQSIEVKYFNWIGENYWLLKSGLPRRLFLYLTKHSDGGRNREFTITVEKLYPRLPIVGNRPSKRSDTLDAAVRDLPRVGITYKYRKNRDGKATIQFFFPQKMRKMMEAPREDRKGLEDLVVRFYSAIGTENISARRREEGVKILAEIQAEAAVGPERLGEMIDWVVARRETKFKGLHSIKVLSKAWDQALSSIKRAEKRKAKTTEEIVHARVDEELARKQKEDLADACAKLSPEELAEIRKEAERRLGSDRKYSFHLAQLASIKNEAERDRQRAWFVEAIENEMIRERAVIATA